MDAFEETAPPARPTRPEAPPRPPIDLGEVPPIDRDALAAELATLDVVLEETMIDGLAAYAARLWAMNERINLTRHTDIVTFVARDVVDAVHLAHQIDVGKEVLDVGSGGGAPAIPLAILRPDLSVTLTESVGKKARALEAIVAGLPVSVTVLSERAEAALEDGRYDVLTVRAVAPIAKLCEWFRPARPMIDQVLALKGPRWIEERGEARHIGQIKGWGLRVAASWTIPGSTIESVLLRLWDQSLPIPTPPTERRPPLREGVVLPPTPDTPPEVKPGDAASRDASEPTEPTEPDATA